jgi:GT2 family glycosyltransferase
MTRRDVFEELGGFDEGFGRALAAADYCLRARQKDYLIVWTPHAVLARREAESGGADPTAVRFQARWRALLREGDPYYNPHLTLAAGFDLRREGPAPGGAAARALKAIRLAPPRAAAAA